jgi:hypothetical protein
LKSRIFSIFWLDDGREGSGAGYRSGSVQIIADPDPGGPKLSNPMDPEHRIFTLLAVVINF